MLFAEGKSTKPAGPQRRATMAAGAKSAAAAAAARIREYKQQRGELSVPCFCGSGD